MFFSVDPNTSIPKYFGPKAFSGGLVPACPLRAHFVFRSVEVSFFLISVALADNAYVTQPPYLGAASVHDDSDPRDKST